MYIRMYALLLDTNVKICNGSDAFAHPIGYSPLVEARRIRRLNIHTILVSVSSSSALILFGMGVRCSLIVKALFSYIGQTHSYVRQSPLIVDAHIALPFVWMKYMML